MAGENVRAAAASSVLHGFGELHLDTVDAVDRVDEEDEDEDEGDLKAVLNLADSLVLGDEAGGMLACDQAFEAGVNIREDVATDVVRKGNNQEHKERHLKHEKGKDLSSRS